MSTPAEKAKRFAAYEEVKDRAKPAPEFGEGWMVLEVVRKGGSQAGHTDRYWYSPNERFRIRSKAEFKRFQLALEAAPRNDEDLAWAILKGNKSAPAAAAVSGPDAGAGHPSSAKPASSTKKKQKFQTSRKAQGKGVPLSRGYIPTITSVRGAASDGPYVDEDEVTRVYNYPKDTARIAELEEKGFYEPELAGVDGDDDEGDADGAPYRHITNWFLAKPSAAGADFGVHRMALPADYRKVKNLCLYGELLPSPRKVARARTKGKDPPKPQPVVLRRLLLWSIDRDYRDRGIWFQTGDAWYKLEQPCTRACTTARARTTSTSSCGPSSAWSPTCWTCSTRRASRSSSKTSRPARQPDAVRIAQRPIAQCRAAGAPPDAPDRAVRYGAAAEGGDVRQAAHSGLRRGLCQEQLCQGSDGYGEGMEEDAQGQEEGWRRVRLPGFGRGSREAKRSEALGISYYLPGR